MKENNLSKPEGILSRLVVFSKLPGFREEVLRVCPKFDLLRTDVR